MSKLKKYYTTTILYSTILYYYYTILFLFRVNQSIRDNITVRADVRLCLYRDRARPDAALPRHPRPLQGPAPGHPARAAGGTPGLQLGRRAVQVMRLINICKV